MVASSFYYFTSINRIIDPGIQTIDHILSDSYGPWSIIYYYWNI